MDPVSGFHIPSGVLFRRVGDEQVLLDLVSGTYYGLDEVGSRIWDLIEAGQTAAEAAEVIAREYNADPDEVRKDVSDFVELLLTRRLIESKAGPNADGSQA